MRRELARVEEVTREEKSREWRVEKVGEVERARER